MTQSVTHPTGGRDRGPRALVQAWVGVLIRPGRFFRSVVIPGDQAPGLTFAMAVVLVEEGSRLLVTLDPVPAIAGGPVGSRLIVLGVAVLLVTPAALHLVTALMTLLLMAGVEDRGGVSETVQIIGYATAPCALAGFPIPELRLTLAAYGSILLILGTAEVHEIGKWVAAIVGMIPAAIVFGYGFRGFDALATLLARWYII